MLPFVLRHADLSLGDDGGGHVDENRFAVRTRRRKCDRVGAQLAVDSSERGDLATEATGVDEHQGYETCPCRGQRIGSRAADVTGVSQSDDTDAVLASLGGSQLNSESSRYLPESASSVDQGGTPSVLQNGGLALRVEGSLEDFFHVLVVA